MKQLVVDNRAMQDGKQEKKETSFFLFLLSLWFDDCQGGLFAVEVTANHREMLHVFSLCNVQAPFTEQCRTGCLKENQLTTPNGEK